MIANGLSNVQRTVGAVAAYRQALSKRKQPLRIESMPRPVAIVLGCDHVGSAVAHRLHCDGFGVVLLDDVDPPWPRRGMSFTDAWYVGTSEVAGVRAVFCASVRSVPAVLERSHAIAATTWSWGGVASALAPAITVEMRQPSRRTLLDRSLAPPVLTIEVMPGAVAGPEFDVAISLAGVRVREPDQVLHARSSSRFTTWRSVGERTRAGEALGYAGREEIFVPVDGWLRGIAARGARLRTGDVIAEIDCAASSAQCFELDAFGVAIASAIAQAVKRECRIGPRLVARQASSARASASPARPKLKFFPRLSEFAVIDKQ